MASHARHVHALGWARGSLCSIALVVSLAAAFAGTASATTKPGVVYKMQVVITDSQVRLVPHKSTGNVLVQYIRLNGRAAQFPRGVAIQFVFTNKGTKTYLPAIGVLNKSQANPYGAPVKNLYTASRAIKPGGQISLFGNFYFRGAFQIEKLFDHKLAKGGSVAVTIY